MYLKISLAQSWSPEDFVSRQKGCFRHNKGSASACAEVQPSALSCFARGREEHSRNAEGKPSCSLSAVRIPCASALTLVD